MGETKDPEGNVATQTPEGTEGLTPKKDQTLTPEVDALVKKANAALTNIGRLEAELKRSQGVATAALSRAKQLEEENYRKQEEEAKEDPAELSRIRNRRRDAERENTLSERETKVKTQLDRLLQVGAKALAGQYNVSEETLLNYAGDDADRMEELAKSYGERTTAGKREVKSTVRMTQPPDDGKTKGGGAGLTKEDVAKMSPEEQFRRSKEIAAISF